MFSGEEYVGIGKNWIEKSRYWVFDLVFKVVVEVNWDVVFHDVNRIFSEFVDLLSFDSFGNNIGDSVSDVWRILRVSFLYFLSKFDMWSISSICIFIKFGIPFFLEMFAQSFGDDQQRQVYFILQKVGD